MSDVTIESIAAELAELVYDRWMAALAARQPVDHGGLEALIVLIDGLRTAALDPQTGATEMKAAIAVLRRLPAFPEHQEFQRLVKAELAGSAVRRAQRI